MHPLCESGRTWGTFQGKPSSSSAATCAGVRRFSLCAWRASATHSPRRQSPQYRRGTRQSPHSSLYLRGTPHVRRWGHHRASSVHPASSSRHTVNEVFMNIDSGFIQHYEALCTEEMLCSFQRLILHSRPSTAARDVTRTCPASSASCMCLNGMWHGKLVQRSRQASCS